MKTDQIPPKVLCINPWIHDFAAFDFWAKPLGLLYIAAVLRKKGAKVSYMDCLDRFHPRESKDLKDRWDGRGPFRKTRIDPPAGLEHIYRKYSRYGIEPEWFIRDLEENGRPDLILITSLMTYWASGVRETIQTIKNVYPDVPVVLGGIYAGLNYEHACEYSLADQVVRGRGEKHLSNIIREYTGFELDKNGSEPFEDQIYPALDLQTRISYAPLLTSRGCPFSCSYCASSFLEPEFYQRRPENVVDEIKHWHGQFGVKNFAFYDDALLINKESHAFVIFEKIINSRLDVWFHTPNALHVKEISREAAGLMFRAGFKTIRLGLETTDFSSRRAHDIKVGQDDFSKAADHLRAAGFKKEQLGAYLLCGLPGQDISEVEASAAFVRKKGITPVLAYYTPIPHTKMWAHALAHSRYDLKAHPVFTNNTLFPMVKEDGDLKRISQLKNLKD